MHDSKTGLEAAARSSKRGKILAAVVLADFAALHVYAIWSGGLEAVTQFLTQRPNEWVFVLGADLVIALGFVLTWMWRDARKQNMSPIPYLLLTLCLGSVGPLLYVLRRPASGAVAEVEPSTVSSRRLEVA